MGIRGGGEGGVVAVRITSLARSRNSAHSPLVHGDTPHNNSVKRPPPYLSFDTEEEKEKEGGEGLGRSIN
jgi:hypothetical protein